jgi:chemotaxis protein MotA
MNKTTIAGLAGGLCLIVISCYLAGSLKAFVNLPSLLIVLGGSFASVTISFSADSLRECLKMLKVLMSKRTSEIRPLIDQFVEFSRMIKKNGRMALEKARVGDPFLKKGMDFVMGNIDPDSTEKMLEQEREAFFEAEMESQKVLDKLAEYSPAWGMIGTLIGLVVMMLRLDDPSAIGPSMAVALITTFYGAVLANLVFSPLASKAEDHARWNFVLRGIVVEGVLSLSREESPRMLEDRLMAYIRHDPVYRKKLEKETPAKKGTKKAK